MKTYEQIEKRIEELNEEITRLNNEIVKLTWINKNKNATKLQNRIDQLIDEKYDLIDLIK